MTHPGKGEDDDLLPCPFCGENPKRRANHAFRDIRASIRCENKKCHVTVVAYAPTETTVERRWNKRKPKPGKGDK